MRRARGSQLRSWIEHAHHVEVLVCGIGEEDKWNGLTDFSATSRGLATIFTRPPFPSVVEPTSLTNVEVAAMLGS